MLMENPKNKKKSAWNHPNIMGVFWIFKSESILPNVTPENNKGKLAISYSDSTF